MGLIAALLLALLLLLALVIVVGHGMWVLIARLFRRPAQASHPEDNDLDVTARQVGHLFQAGLIDSATFAAVDSAIRSAQTPQAIRPPPLPVLPHLPVLALPVESIESGAQTAAPPFASAAGFSTPPPLPRLADRPAPRRPLSEVFASFMERKNIRWGELVGGLLIVGCSIALVLSFWAQIQQHPVMKFSIFTAVTAGLFTLGLYSEHRWKLPTTSRGILLTATLLIPLNFLAFAAFSHGVPAADPITLGGEIIAFALFFALAWSSARVIAPQWPAWLTVGVMTLSAGSLAVRYLTVNAGDAELPLARVLWLSAVVVACYAVTSGGVFVRVRQARTLDLAGANAALLSLAVLSFTAAFPLTLVVSRGAEGSLHRLAPLIGLAALPALAGGILLRKRIVEPALVRLRIAATAVSVLGAALLLAGIALAWPNPAEMLATSIVAFVAFFAIALSEGSALWLSAAQGAATLAAASAVMFWLDRGNLTSERDGVLLTHVATWRIIAAVWASLSLTWALLRIVGRVAVPAPATDAAPTWQESVRMLVRLPVTFDRLMSASLLTVLAALALFTTSNAVLAELADQFVLPDAIGSQIVLAVTGSLPWFVLAMLLAAHVISAWETLRRNITWQALATVWIACPLWTADYSGGAAGGASAFRWIAAGWLLLAAGLVWWHSFAFPPPSVRRGRAGEGAWPENVPGEVPLANPPPGYRGRERKEIANFQRSPFDAIDALLLLLGVLPIVALSLCADAAILSGNAGPVAPGLFHAISPIVSYMMPLLAIVAFLIGESLRHRSNGYALAAVLAVNVLVSTAYVVATAGSGALDTPHLVRLIQLNIATAAAATLGWFVLWSLGVKRRQPAAAQPPVLQACAWIALASNLLLIVPAAGELFVQPGGALSLAAQAGSIWGWLALGLGSASALIITIVRGRSPLRLAGLALPMVAALVALTAAAWDRGNWFSFHVWMGAQTAAAWAIVGLGWWFERRGGRWADATTGSYRLTENVPAQVAKPPPYPPPEYRRRGNSPEATLGSGEGAVVLGYQPPATPAQTSRALSYVGGSAIRWAGMLGLLAVILALRAGLGDPAAPWPSAAVIVFVGLLAAALAVWTPAPAALYPAAGLLNLAATLVYGVEAGRFGGASALGFIEINIAALALPAIAWLVLELHVFRRLPGRRRGWPVHQFAACAAVGVLGAAIAICFVRSLLGFPTAVPPLLDATAFAALAGLLVACLRDEPPVPALGLLYVLGLIACARLIECIDLPANRIVWAGALVLAAYGLLTSSLYAIRGVLQSLTVRVGLPAARQCRLPWLELANVGLAAAVLAIAFWSDFAFESLGLRLLPALAALTQTASICLLARRQDHSGRKDIIQVAVLIGVAAVLATCWAFFAPTSDTQGLQHAAVAAGLLAAVAVPLALVVAGKPVRADGGSDDGFSALGAISSHSASSDSDSARDETRWFAALQAVSPLLIVSCLVSLAAALGLEGYAQATIGRVDMPAWAIAAVAAAAGACCIAAVILAMRTQTGDAEQAAFGSYRGQSGCVYAAEGLLALLFFHARLTLPFLFHGYLERYWPLIVMAIAFAGVGLGEVFRRRGRMAFAEPLQRTGAFLPLIPVLAFWVSTSQVHYTLLLLVAAALYGSLAFLRKSTPYGLMAALAGNGSLWYLLSGSENLRFFAHPQVWVIPAALSGLIAAELDRSRLTAAQLRTARYFFVVVLYLSSTADIFINAVAYSPWLPLVLAALSVAGVLAGVALRVRPFLFLGTAFLTLSIVAMIYNAAATLHVTWIWYVAGIILGLFIILLFALFEKKRSTMIALVDGLKAWQ